MIIFKIYIMVRLHYVVILFVLRTSKKFVSVGVCSLILCVSRHQRESFGTTHLFLCPDTIAYVCLYTHRLCTSTHSLCSMFSGLTHLEQSRFPHACVWNRFYTPFFGQHILCCTKVGYVRTSL